MKKIINRVIATTACLIAVAIIPISASALSKGTCSYNWKVTNTAEAMFQNQAVGDSGTITIYLNCCSSDTGKNYWIKVNESYTPACSNMNHLLQTSSNCNNGTPVLTQPRTFNPTGVVSMIDNPSATTNSLPCQPSS
jgi:hypothetical protein